MISIIIPFYNEKENLPILVDRLVKELKNKDYELVLVNDGSNDNFKFEIFNFYSKINFKFLNHKKKLGKGMALKTGVENSSGDTIVFMDADLQDDPTDLEKFFKKIDEEYDFVNGIRLNRHKENFLLELYSSLAGLFLKTFLNSPYTDINCGFKAFRRKVLKGFVFYGNNFRFFPLFVFYNGFKVGEIEVKNNPRKFGRSKFGPGKLVGGIFDTLTAYFLYRFSEKPLHFFGSIGTIIFSLGFLLSLYLTVERLFFGVLLVTRPILWLGILLIIIGIQIVMTGIIGELIVYINKKDK